jgi:uncharacterized protein YndB with AHSA1/START domain
MNPQDPSAELLVYEFDIQEPLEKVWHALTAPELLLQWLLPQPGEPDAGSIEFERVACQPPGFVAYRWRGEQEPDTLVTFELHNAANGSTRLRLTHSAALPRASTPVAFAQAA